MPSAGHQLTHERCYLSLKQQQQQRLVRSVVMPSPNSAKWSRCSFRTESTEHVALSPVQIRGHEATALIYQYQRPSCHQSLCLCLTLSVSLFLRLSLRLSVALFFCLHTMCLSLNAFVCVSLPSLWSQCICRQSSAQRLQIDACHGYCACARSVPAIPRDGCWWC